jgi:hypothetical protein
LWLHSPIDVVEVRSELDRLGPVTWRVAPNLMHHLFQRPCQEAYPDSRLAAPAGLAAKRADLRIDMPLSAPPPEWSDWIETKAISGGNPTLDESVFLHRESRTLVLTDLAAGGKEALRSAFDWLLRE